MRAPRSAAANAPRSTGEGEVSDAARDRTAAGTRRAGARREHRRAARHEELLLDRATYAYLGQRSTVVRDATVDSGKAGNAAGAVRRGSEVVATRVASAVVEEPGER
jgi:hypothetical protein